MCAHIETDEVITKEEIIAFKVVRKTVGLKPKYELRYFSQYDPDQRSLQKGFIDIGDRFEYVIGQEVTSKAPGIYLYASELYALGACTGLREVILKVSIPKNTAVHFGLAHIKSADKIIIARRINVLERI